MDAHGIPRLLTVAEVAKIARAPRSSVQYWIYSGRLQSRRVGRRRLVTEDELCDFLQTGRVTKGGRR